jgi:hypothetical protein
MRALVKVPKSEIDAARRKELKRKPMASTRKRKGKMSMRLDRFLETCCRRKGTDIVFAPNRRPVLRTNDGWMEFQSDTVSPSGIKALADDRLSVRVDGNVEVYAYSDFRYGDEATFRAIAFGYPDTNLLVISRIDCDPNPPLDESSI